MASKKYERVGDILPAVLKSVGIEQKLKEQQLLALWPSVVGEEIAARTRASKVERGVLYVLVDNSAWLQELHFMEGEISRKLRKAAPEVKIKKIRFTMGQ